MAGKYYKVIIPDFVSLNDNCAPFLFTILTCSEVKIINPQMLYYLRNIGPTSPSRKTIGAVK